MYTYACTHAGVMAPVKACLATLLVFAALYHFLQSSKESDLDYMLQTADWKLRVTSILSLTMRKQLSAMDKVSRQVHKISMYLDMHLESLYTASDVL